MCPPRVPLEQGSRITFYVRANVVEVLFGSNDMVVESALPYPPVNASPRLVLHSSKVLRCRHGLEPLNHFRQRHSGSSRFVIRAFEEHDTVAMVGHDGVRIQRHRFKFLRQLQPPPFDHFASVVQLHAACRFVQRSQQGRAFIDGYGDKVRARRRVVEVPQTQRAAHADSTMHPVRHDGYEGVDTRVDPYNRRDESDHPTAGSTRRSTPTNRRAGSTRDARQAGMRLAR